MNKKINDLTDTITHCQNKLKQLRLVYTKFPDLEIKKERNSEYYCSTIANPQVTHVGVGFSCNCCSAPSIVARPYLKDNETIVYSNSCSFHLGESGFGFKENWVEELKNNNISQEIINEIATFEEKYSHHDNGEDADYT